MEGGGTGIINSEELIITINRKKHFEHVLKWYIKPSVMILFLPIHRKLVLIFMTHLTQDYFCNDLVVSLKNIVDANFISCQRQVAEKMWPFAVITPLWNCLIMWPFTAYTRCRHSRPVNVFSHKSSCHDRSKTFKIILHIFIILWLVCW